MPDETFRPRRELFVLLLISLAALIFGGLIVASGWNGLLSGEILVYPKNLPPYLATTSGPHASEFQFHVWLRLIGGSVCVVVGILVPIALAVAPPARRTQMLRVSSSVRSPTMPKGLVLLTFAALALFLLWSFFSVA